MGAGEKGKSDLAKMSEADLIARHTKKYKKRAKKICCCATIWMLIGIILFIIGIVLLVYFAEFWNDDTTRKQGLAYTGCALLLGGFVILGIGITCFGVLYCVYRKYTMKEKKSHTTFRPPTFEYGKAPYPQQPPIPMTNNPGQSPAQGGMVPPSAPPRPADAGEVRVEITENVKL